MTTGSQLKRYLYLSRLLEVVSPGVRDYLWLRPQGGLLLHPGAASLVEMNLRDTSFL